MTRIAADVASDIEKAVQHLNALLVEASGENDVTVVMSVNGGTNFDGDDAVRTNAKPFALEPLKVQIDLMVIE